MRKKEPETTYIFEAKFQLIGHERNLFVTMNTKEWERIVNVLEGGSVEFRFYGADPCEGYEVFINPKHVSKINLLENMPGIKFIAKKPKTDEEQDRIQENREQSSAEYIFRIWSIDGLIETYSGITFENCEGIRPLEDNIDMFIGFMDEDGERVMLNLDHIAAFEIFDTFFLSDDELSEFMKIRGEESDNIITSPVCP
jgi:hypothetical protein